MRLVPDDIVILDNKLIKLLGKYIILNIKNEVIPEMKPIGRILRFWDNILNKSRLSNLLFNSNSKSKQANKLTNVVENTNPFTPKFRGDSSPHGLGPPIKNQSKNKFSNIAINDILNGVLASSIP